MRWLLIVLVVSVCALLVASAGVALHIWRQHRNPPAATEASARADNDIESEEAP
jgi:uncharacterized iron-regulated membrane protein